MPNGTQYGQIETGYKGTWVDDLLNAIGAPTTDSNRAALRAWAASEGTVNSNNPLAISGKAPGATTCLAQCGSSSPIYAYDNMNDGVAATSAFLLHNNYASVIAGFRQDLGLGTIFNAINQSGWCKGCQGGHYPNALFAAVGGNPGNAVPPAGTGGSPSSSGGGLTIPNPLDAGATKITILSAAQEKTFEGWFLMIAGGFIGAVGIAVVLASLGLESKITRAIPGPVGFAAGEVQARSSSSSSAPPPPAPAAAYRAGYDMGGRDENARREGQASNARNRRQSGPSAPGARRVSAEQRRGSRNRLERSRAGLSPEQRRQADSF